jgi:hypothetical protein
MKKIIFTLSIAVGMISSNSVMSYEVGGLRHGVESAFEDGKTKHIQIAANRKGSKRKGGTNSHGKGSHYTGGKKRA